MKQFDELNDKKSSLTYKYYLSIAGAVVVLLILFFPTLKAVFQGETGGKTSSENKISFSEINDMEDLEYSYFNWHDESNEFASNSFILYPEDEGFDKLISDIKGLKVIEGNLDVDDVDFEQPEIFVLGMVHDEDKNIQTAVTVNENGSVHIWNRYSNEVPEFFKSEGNTAFYEKVDEIIMTEKDKNQDKNTYQDHNEVEFEYKSEDETTELSVLELRSEDGDLIADMNDIEPGSAEVVTDEHDLTSISVRFIDKKFVHAFSSAHIDEKIHFYIDGELEASPMLRAPIASNNILISGGFEDVAAEELVEKINDNE